MGNTCEMELAWAREKKFRAELLKVLVESA